MSDTIDREKLEDTNNESKDTAPEESEAAAAEMPADPLEPAKQEGGEESAAEEPETAEQFPRIAPEDLPSQTIKDIPYVEDDLPTLEEDVYKRQTDHGAGCGGHDHRHASASAVF